MKRYTEQAGTSEDVTVRMKKNMFSWFGHVERMSDERMAKKIYDGKVSGKRGRARPWLTFENTVSKILEEGHVKSMRTPRRACMKRLMTADKAKEIEGEAWKQVYGALEYAELKFDAFKYLEVDMILHSYGLVVKREYRGRKLSSKILDARERLCAPLGIKATATVFTGPASQRSAAKAGFEVVAVTSLKELADRGFKYPNDENRLIKLMVKKFV